MELFYACGFLFMAFSDIHIHISMTYTFLLAGFMHDLWVDNSHASEFEAPRRDFEPLDTTQHFHFISIFLSFFIHVSLFFVMNWALAGYTYATYCI